MPCQFSLLDHHSWMDDVVRFSCQKVISFFSLSGHRPECNSVSFMKKKRWVLCLDFILLAINTITYQLFGWVLIVSVFSYVFLGHFFCLIYPLFIFSFPAFNHWLNAIMVSLSSPCIWKYTSKLGICWSTHDCNLFMLLILNWLRKF